VNGPSARNDARRAAGELKMAMAEIVDVFIHQVEVADSLVAVLETDTPMTELVANFAVESERVRMAVAFDGYETWRRHTRVAIWRLLHEEGCSLAEISRMFGVSRQLVSRQLRGRIAD
jgi:hypothetical protein